MPSSNNEAITARLKLVLPKNDINGMAQEAFDNAEAHGFHARDPFYIPPVPEMLMLIVSEAAEAMEEHRKSIIWEPIRYREDGKPEGFGPELADIIIRVGHLAAAQDIDLADMVAQVQAFNRTRPHKHGKKY